MTPGRAKHLTRLINGAWQRVPFYAKHWRDVGTRLPSMRFPDQLNELPIVQKSDLLTATSADRLDQGFLDHRLIVEKTSGSSGQPMEIHKDPASVRRRGLRFLRALLSCGYRPGQRLMLISTHHSGGGSGGLMSFARWHYCDLRDEQLLEAYQRLRPEVLYGPLSSLLQICDRAENTRDLHVPSLVISTAEQLLPAQRTLLETTFKIAVADFYGMTEIGLIAFRRAPAVSFEAASADLLLEFLPLAGDDSHERLVVTDLTGGAMPLIRYDTGDLVCRHLHNGASVIGEFVGRRVDSIRLPSGSTISPYRFTMRLEALSALRQYQVIQRQDLSLDVYVHCDERHTETVREQIFTALGALCADLPARVHYQKNALPRVAGKFRTVQSEARAGA